MRKYSKRFLVPFTPFELELVRYLMLKERLSMGSHVRHAVRSYVHEHPEFDGQEFEHYLRDEILPGVEHPAEQEQMTEELEAFLSEDEVLVRGMPRVAVSSAVDFARSRNASS